MDVDPLVLDLPPVVGGFGTVWAAGMHPARPPTAGRNLSGVSLQLQALHAAGGGRRHAGSHSFFRGDHSFSNRSVTAPSDALLTSRAYLASTPAVA